jgi:hypothetical protein
MDGIFEVLRNHVMSFPIYRVDEIWKVECAARWRFVSYKQSLEI